MGWRPRDGADRWDWQDSAYAPQPTLPDAATAPRRAPNLRQAASAQPPPSRDTWEPDPQAGDMASQWPDSHGSWQEPRGREPPTTEQILDALCRRELARNARWFSVADNIRTALRRQGVDVNDVHRTWSTVDGRSGTRPDAADPRCVRLASRKADTCEVALMGGQPAFPMTEAEVHNGLRERAMAWHKGAYPAVTRIDRILREAGVVIDDENGWWTDGRGRYGWNPGPQAALWNDAAP